MSTAEAGTAATDTAGPRLGVYFRKTPQQPWELVAGPFADRGAADREMIDQMASGPKVGDWSVRPISWDEPGSVR